MRSRLRAILVRWGSLVFNLRGVLSLYRLVPFVLQWARFSGRPGMPAPATDLYPCLADATLKTSFDPHYFYQAAWLARKLAASRPSVHTDIASDVGMIGVISAFVPVEFLDLRPLDAALPGLKPGKDNLSALALPSSSVQSLSCLHVIEHIGLGRYGDALDPEGHAQAAAELSRVLAEGGDLYLSVPVGRERACFNAHRVFSVNTVKRLFAPLELRGFALVDDHGRFTADASESDAGANEYGCGLFHFVKRAR